MKKGEKLVLPDLVADQVKHPIGTIFHTLNQGQEETIQEVTDQELPSGRKLEVLTLSDGQRVIVTAKSGLQRPSGVDGILQIRSAKLARWVSHVRLDAYRESMRGKGPSALKEEVHKTWDGAFTFIDEKPAGGSQRPGLRPPQNGALHSIGAHWSLSNAPATIVMPTGTGKTETMLAALVAYRPRTILVVVPSKALRDQTRDKFRVLGLLRMLGVLSRGASNPIVGVITKTLNRMEHLSLFERCNVVISTMAVLTQRGAEGLVNEIAKRVDVLIVDEAHHVPSRTWSDFRAAFTGARVLQFTATPFRLDRQLVDGAVIFNYPLRDAQRDGYFKKISFEGVFTLDTERADEEIADAAIARLKADLAAGRDHVVMARCETIQRAEVVHAIYLAKAPEFFPLLVHSEQAGSSKAIEELRERRSRIAVCVDMLGEGFDLPQLKIAAMHDTHKSLAILLQFTGRFTRSAPANVGDATVIANTADPRVPIALERLYSEDADWNVLLSESSSEAIRQHREFIEFLRSSRRLDDDSDEDVLQISHQLLRPTLSMLVFEAASFSPQRFHNGVPNGTNVLAVWHHTSSKTLYFVARSTAQVDWSRSQDLKQKEYNLFVLHYDEATRLLYINASDKSSEHERLAIAVGGEHTRLFRGESIFKAMGGVSRLLFQNAGLRKFGRRNLSFTMFTGSDVKNALTPADLSRSIKSNLSGSGWERGKPTTIGCAYKGRVWSRDVGTIPEFVAWAKRIGQKLRDVTIRPEDVFANAMMQAEVPEIPDSAVLSIEWPSELLRQSEERVILHVNVVDYPLATADIGFVTIGTDRTHVRFGISLGGTLHTFELTVGVERGYSIKQLDGASIGLKIGNRSYALDEYLENYPPLIRFVNLTELDGNLLASPTELRPPTIADEQFEPWEWTGVNIEEESIWKNGAKRSHSIQEHVANRFRDGGFEIVFDDDGPGEAADLICIKEESDHLRLALVHCKFSHSATAGSRLADVVEVCSQATRSAKWSGRFRELLTRIVRTESRAMGSGRGTRFVNGTSQSLRHLENAQRFKEVRIEIVIAQPGLSKANRSAEQETVFAAAETYLIETVGVHLDVLCSP